MLYAIGDLHLSLGSNKPMDVFGEKWENYVSRLSDGYASLNNEDTCVLCGDISWGMSLEESLEDFRFIDKLPGKKIILKGNHDYWWTSMKKTEDYFAANGITSIKILHNNFYTYNDIAICGTRGWFFQEEKGDAHDKKVMNREIMRLEASLKAAGDREKLCFLHYPPVYNDYICEEMLAVMEKYGVKSCRYGHIHGIGHRYAVTGEYRGVDYHMVSADYVGFVPQIVL